VAQRAGEGIRATGTATAMVTLIRSPQ